MIVVDSSIFVAIFLFEPDADDFIRRLEDSNMAVAATPTIVETLLVLAGRKISQPQQKLATLLHDLKIRIVPFDEAALHHALDGLIRYGKGRHAAKLNFGDCISYGLAKALGVPLLFKGDDFALTDIKQA